MKGDHESGYGHQNKPEIVYYTIVCIVLAFGALIPNGCSLEEAVRFCQYADNRDGEKAAAFSVTQSPADVGGGRILQKR